MRLFAVGGSANQSGKVLIDKEKIKEVIAQGGKLSLAEVLRLRVRHLSDGAMGNLASPPDLSGLCARPAGNMAFREPQESNWVAVLADLCGLYRVSAS